MLKKFMYTAILFVSFTSLVNATIVEFQTSEGNFQVNLFDQGTPATVANFLQYVDEQHYTNSVVHRVASGFVVQGGGFTFEGDWPLERIETNPAVINEPVNSNVRGTISMAKLGGDPNSATDQWFFNLKNNNTGTANGGNLDLQNGGFTAFGQVIGDGMTVVEKIAELELCQSIPMTGYSSESCTDLATPGLENFVVINQIVIIDSSEATAADLNPTKNTLIGDSGDSGDSDENKSSGGTVFWLSLFSLLMISVRRFTLK